MKLFRFRKPSIRTLSGYTRISKRARRSAGISRIEAVTKPSRVKQKITYEAGLYSQQARAIRQTSKGRFPSFLGFFNKK